MIHAMVVERDPMVADINRRILQADARVESVRLCADGEGAWEELLERPAELVVLDIQLPGTDGFALLRRLRGAGMKTEAIIVTAADDWGSLDEAMRLGVLDYLVKPFEYQRLQGAVERFFRKRELVGNATKPFSQREADLLFSVCTAAEAPEEPEKGIYLQTLDRISAFFRARQRERYSCGQVAQALSLSRVTVQKYLRYLEGKQRLRSEVDYRTEGRPCVRYFMDG